LPFVAAIRRLITPSKSTNAIFKM